MACSSRTSKGTLPGDRSLEFDEIMLKILRLMVVLAAVPLFTLGCAEELIDCTDICTDVEDCIGDEFGVRDCRQSCQEQSQNAINECDACLDDNPNSCGPCLAECTPLGLMIAADM